MYFEDETKKKLEAIIKESSQKIIDDLKREKAFANEVKRNIIAAFWIGIIGGIILSTGAYFWYVVFNVIFP